MAQCKPIPDVLLIVVFALLSGCVGAAEPEGDIDVTEEIMP